MLCLVADLKTIGQCSVSSKGGAGGGVLLHFLRCLLGEIRVLNKIIFSEII